MRRPEFIARQARCPSGVLGHLLARVMAIETAADNERALQLLALRPADQVPEIGFGHGWAFRFLLGPKVSRGRTKRRSRIAAASASPIDGQGSCQITLSFFSFDRRSWTFSGLGGLEKILT